MDDYNFLADLLTTFRLSPDWIKALIVIIPWVFLLGVLCLILNFRLKIIQTTESDPPPGRLLPVVRQDGRWKVVAGDKPDNLILSGRVKPKTRH